MAATLLISGCNASKDKAAAEAAVGTFHQKLGHGDFAGIYADTHPDFKKASTEKDFVALLEAVHRKLGPIVETQQTGWRVNSHNFNTNISLAYKTKFTGGDAVESFVYRADDGNVSLLAYNINSQALILK